MTTQHLTRRSCMATALLFVSVPVAFGTSRSAAQRISLAATYKKKALATRLDWLNERLLTEIAAMPLDGFDHVEPDTIMHHLDEIGTILTVLRDGSEEHGLGVERSVGVQFALDDMREVWGEYEPIARRVVEAGGPTTADLEELERLNETFETMAAALVDKIYDIYSDKVMTVETARSLKILSHSITRTQTMKKYLVLAVVGFHADEELAKLGEAANIFNLQIQALVKDHANYGMAPPPTPEAEAALARVGECWAELSGIIDGLTVASLGEPGALDRYWAKSDVLNKSLYAALVEYEGTGSG